MSSDNNFVPFLSVMLQSILDNTSHNRIYHFYILHRNIDVRSISILEQQVNNFSNCKIEFIDVSHIFKTIPIRQIAGIWSLDTYSRLLIPYMFAEYPKVIYLDVDMLCQTDIAKLYDIDLQGKPLGAVYDSKLKYHFENNDTDFIYNNSATVLLGLDDWRQFNGGLEVFDTIKFSEMISLNELLRFTIWFTHRAEWFWVDQCVLNLLLKENWYHLPKGWNANEWNLIVNEFETNDTDYYLNNWQSMEILHFNSKFKPWNSNICPDICNHYRKYASNVQLYKERFPHHQYHLETTREDMIWHYFPKNSVGMEIGVFMGEFSEYLYNTLDPKMLYLVDPFEPNKLMSGDKDGTNFITVHNLREYAAKKIIPKFKYKSNVQIISDYSFNVLPLIKDKTLDWVYIDGDHSYQGCLKDLLLARQKVKDNGIIAGHDYHPEMGVMQAVDKFCERFGLQIEVATLDGMPSFLIRNVYHIPNMVEIE
jgi:lipopolysaccharide biosynthesis glycosyltransferase